MASDELKQRGWVTSRSVEATRPNQWWAGAAHVAHVKGRVSISPHDVDSPTARQVGIDIAQESGAQTGGRGQGERWGRAPLRPTVRPAGAYG